MEDATATVNEAPWEDEPTPADKMESSYRGRNNGLLKRAALQLEWIANHEKKLQTLLEHIRGSNISKMPEVKEHPPAGLPNIYEVVERRQKACDKLLDDLTNTF